MTPEEWARIKEMLGLTDLPFKPENISVSHAYKKPTVLQVTFSREMTPYELQQFQKISQGRWLATEED